MAMALMFAAGCSDKDPPTGPAKVVEQHLSKELPQELEQFRPTIEAAKLDFVRINASARQGTTPRASKFRGTPYRPKGVEWPTGSDGQPLTLLVQINFSDMPPLAGYPKAGILQFFIGGEGGGAHPHMWGMGFYEEKPYDPERYFQSLQYQANFRVIYYPDLIADDSGLDTTSPPQPKFALPVMSEAELSFAPGSEYVTPWDYRFERVFGKEAHELFAGFGPREQGIAEQYIRFTHREALAKLGGYASFVQDDPRKIRSSEDWLVLLDIRSGVENGVDVMWGDAGVGALLIRRDDLEKLDFSRVAYYWDNH